MSDTPQLLLSTEIESHSSIIYLDDPALSKINLDEHSNYSLGAGKFLKALIHSFRSPPESIIYWDSLKKVDGRTKFRNSAENDPHGFYDYDAAFDFKSAQGTVYIIDQPTETKFPASLFTISSPLLSLNMAVYDIVILDNEGSPVSGYAEYKSMLFPNALRVKVFKSPLTIAGGLIYADQVIRYRQRSFSSH
jgi:hypothetical protein